MPSSIRCWADGCRLRRSAAAALHRKRFRRIAAAVSAGVGHRAARMRRYRLGDYAIPAASILLMSPYAVHRDPRWFPEPDTIRSRALAAGGCRDAPEVRLFPVRRRRARVHRRALRVDGRRAASGHDRAALALAPGTRTSRGDARPDYVTSETRDGDDGGVPLDVAQAWRSRHLLFPY